MPFISHTSMSSSPLGAATSRPLTVSLTVSIINRSCLMTPDLARVAPARLGDRGHDAEADDHERPDRDPGRAEPQPAGPVGQGTDDDDDPQHVKCEIHEPPPDRL